MEEFLLNNITEFSYFGIFGFLILCGLGVPIPEDIILFTSGYLIYKGYLNYPLSVVVATVGIIGGDSIIFFVGKKFGRRMLRQKKFFLKIITLKRLLKAKRFFRKHGNKAIFLGRFLPGLRAPLFFTSGLLNIRPMVFITLDFFAALISVPLFIYLAYYFGAEISWFMATLKNIQKYVFIGIATLVAIYFGYRYFRKKTAKEQD